MRISWRQGVGETGERRETELALLFERLISAYLESVAQSHPVAMYANKLRLLAKARPGSSAITLSKEGSVSIEASTKTDEMLADLSAAFDALVDVTAFASGQKEAYEGAASVARSVLKQFSGSKHATSVEKSILKGYLAEGTKLGLRGEELVVPEGILKNTTMLLESPPGTARERLLLSMLKAELDCGGAAVVVLGTKSPADIRKALADVGVKSGAYESKGSLRFVDWFSYRERAVNGIEVDKTGAFLASGDLTNLALAMERAAGQIGFAPCIKIIADVVSPAINSHGAAKTHDFVQSVSGKLKTGGAVVVWAFDPKGLDTKTITSLHNLADSVLSAGQGAKGATIEVVSMRGARFNRGKFQLVQTRDGVMVASEGVDESDAMEALQSLPGVDEEAARALFDAGYHSVDRLEKADQAAMSRIIGPQKASDLHDYMHSMDYARRMLLERSGKWVEKAMHAAAEGNLGAAVENLRRALEITEENAEAWFDLGHLLYDQGKKDEARDCYLRATKLDKVYEGEWYGEDKDEVDSLFACSTCGGVIESEATRCPGCGMVLTLDERRRLAECLEKKR